MEESEIRGEFIRWITAYKDVAERNALAEAPDESADYLLAKIREVVEGAGLTEDVLGSPLWRPLHDILIDWNEGRIKLAKQGSPGLVNQIAKGENNIKAVKQMVKVVARAQLQAVKDAIDKEGK